jgi:hypothetical protein
VAVFINGVRPAKPQAGAEFVLAMQLLPWPLDEGVPTPAGPLPVTYELDLPPAITVKPAGPVSFGPGYPPGTSSTCVTACAADIAEGGPVTGVQLYYRLVASAPGSYRVTARAASSSRPDPDPADNQASITVDVTAAAAAGVTAGRVVVAPAAPRVGRAYSMFLPLTRAGAPVKPTSVRCTATLRGAALRGSAARLATGARCTWKLPAGSRGAQLKSRLTAVVGGRTFTASRTARVR